MSERDSLASKLPITLITGFLGSGKTTLAQALARSVDSKFLRLQFTSDMLPSDVLGVTIFNAHTQEFEFKKGPCMASPVRRNA